MPTPLSITEIVSCEGVRSDTTLISPPSDVYLMAFESRL